MDLVVKKFGGTSVANVERIKRVARIIAGSDTKNIVVVSAMAGTTNQLVGYAKDIGIQNLDEYDTVISAGEQITVGLVTMALQSLGIKAKSYLGWQVPIITNDNHSTAKILEIPTDRILEDVENGITPVIAGFQGIANGRITTLGRGGSDTSAVAIAVAANAKRCDIYTDVDGIFTGDPRVITKARKIDKIDYNSVLEMAASGAKVIHPRAVEIAMQNNMPITILNTFSDDLGTEITNDNHLMEKTQILGIAVKKDIYLITIKHIQTTELSSIIEDLTKQSIQIDSIHQQNVEFSPEKQLLCDYNIFFSSEHQLPESYQVSRNRLAKVSVIGIGLKNDFEVTRKVMFVLKDVEVLSMQRLETQLSFIIEESLCDKVTRDLHTIFEMDA